MAERRATVTVRPVPTTTSPRRTAVALACVVLALVTGCRAEPPVAAPTTPATSTPAPASSSSPTPAPTTSPAPDAPSPEPTTSQTPTAAPQPPAPSASATPSPTPSPTAARTVTLPEPGAAFEYQLGGPDDPAEGTTVVVRDVTATPSGRYDVCYVNGFQTQPSETQRVLRETPELVLHHDGEPVRDEGWPDELLYDITSPSLRERVAARVGRDIDTCAAKGFDAVEVDNLDSYTRSLGLVDTDDTLAYAALLVARAHAAGLAYAQKNTAELVDEVRALGADLVVAEECAQWDECDVYTSVYPVVLDVEYDRATFTAACAAQRDPATHDPRLSVILRDHDVLPRGRPGAVHETC